MLSRKWVRRVIAAACAICMPLSARLLHAALPPSTSLNVSGPTSVAGQLLIATPAMTDPPFEHAVILVTQHNQGGAIGIVINRPLDRQTIASLLAAYGAEASGVNGSVLLFLGGPVDPQAGFVLHSTDYRNGDTLDVDGRVALTSGPQILRDIGFGKGPRQKLVAFGYSGWGPSQLDNELRQGIWQTVPEDPTLVFEDDRAKVWSDALARRKTN